MRAPAVFGTVLLTIALGCASPVNATGLLNCTVTSPMKHDVGEGGYSFSAYSNLAKLADLPCLQWILQNHSGNTAVRVRLVSPI